jgi:hypothetical protein
MMLLGPQQQPEERRTMRRFDMRLPAIVRVGTKSGQSNAGATSLATTSEEGANEFHTETQNVSARGVFLYLDRAVKMGAEIEVTLIFPPHITLTDAVRVRFMARVIRIENATPTFRIGTAAVIEDYEFLRSNDAPDFFSALQTDIKTAN